MKQENCTDRQKQKGSDRLFNAFNYTFYQCTLEIILT